MGILINSQPRVGRVRRCPDQSLCFCLQNSFQFSIHSLSVKLIVVFCVVSRFAISVIQALYDSRERSMGREAFAVTVYSVFIRRRPHKIKRRETIFGVYVKILQTSRLILTKLLLFT